MASPAFLVRLGQRVRLDWPGLPDSLVKTDARVNLDPPDATVWTDRKERRDRRERRAKAA